MFFDTKYGKINYEYFGEGEEVLVFIHSFALDISIYKNRLEEISKNCRVLLLDLPNHGKSFDIDYGRNNYKVLEECLLSLLDYLNINRFYIAGESLGGMYAQVFTSRNPQKVKGVICMGANVIGEGIKRWQVLLISIFISFLLILPKSLLYKIALIGKTKRKNIRDYILVCLKRRGIKEMIKIGEFVIFDKYIRVDNRLNVKSLFICGEFESKMIKNSCRKNFPRRYLEIDNAAHLVYLDAYKRVNNEIINFISKDKN